MEREDGDRSECGFSDDDLVRMLRQRWEDAHRDNGGAIPRHQSMHICRIQVYARNVFATSLSIHMHLFRLCVSLTGVLLPKLLPRRTSCIALLLPSEKTISDAELDYFCRLSQKSRAAWVSEMQQKSYVPALSFDEIFQC
jgi:hypothetical protein